MRKLLATVAIAAAFTAAPAMAQDGGLYVGVLAGYEGIDVDSADGAVSADADSSVYGATIGYDLSLGNAFVGVEGEIAKSDSTATFPDSFGAARESLSSDAQYYVGARAGVALTPGIAAYGKIGYTSIDVNAFTESGSLAELEENASGLRYGAGVQVALPGPLEARVEYRRSEYDAVDGTEFGDAASDQLVAGIGLRF